MLGSLPSEIQRCIRVDTERASERIHLIPDYETDTGNLSGRKEIVRTIIGGTPCSASASGKTTGRCFVCVPETKSK